MSSPAEISDRFACFGSWCEAFVGGASGERSPEEALELVKDALTGWDQRFSRFRGDSELTRLNEDPRGAVPVSPLMARLAEIVHLAGSTTGGLVDSTLIDELATAGYDRDLRDPLALASALAQAPARRPAAASPRCAWAQLEVDRAGGLLRRPPGVKLDSGGLAKGLFADVLAERLQGHSSFAVNCAGDLSIGGRESILRAVNVESPFDASILHTFELARGGVATSGIGKRSWLDARGAPAHHLLDPSTGTPAFTGIVQVTALAPSAVMAEIQAKAAILSGPRHARRWLAHGGVIVLEDGSHTVIDPPPVVTLRQPSAAAQPTLRRAVQHA